MKFIAPMTYKKDRRYHEQLVVLMPERSHSQIYDEDQNRNEFETTTRRRIAACSPAKYRHGNNQEQPNRRAYVFTEYHLNGRRNTGRVTNVRRCCVAPVSKPSR